MDNLAIRIGGQRYVSVPAIQLPTDKQKNQSTCRMCVKIFGKRRGELLHENGELTSLGLQLNVILNRAHVIYPQESAQCCKSCGTKIKTAFAMLIELRATDSIVPQLVDSVYITNQPPHLNTFVFQCDVCFQKQRGLESYIRHYEEHFLFKEIVIPSSEEASHEVKSNKYVYEPIVKLETFDKLSFNNLENQPNLDSTADLELEDDPEDYLYISDIWNTEIIKSEEDEKMEKAALLEELKQYTIDSFPKDFECFSLLELKILLDDFKKNDDNNTESEDEIVNIVEEELNVADDTDDDEVFQMNGIVNNNSHTCAQCNLQFYFNFELRAHLAQHRNDLNLELGERKKQTQCHLCQRHIPCKDYSKHFSECLRSHEGMKILCTHCGEFISSEDFVQHSRKERIKQRRNMPGSEEYKCDICHKTNFKKRELRRHIYRTHFPVKITCEICGKYLTKNSMIKHRKKHGEKKQICSICGKAFYYLSELTLHMRVHTVKEEKAPKIPKKRMQPVNIKCHRCDVLFYSRSEFISHLRKTHKSWHCKYCCHPFQDQNLYNLHLPECPNLPWQQISAKLFKCKQCEHHENSYGGIICHVEINHSTSIKKEKEEKKSTQAKKTICELCEQPFSSNISLAAHVKAVHLNIRNHVCKICGKAFKKGEALKNHEYIHSGIKNYECEVCTRKFRVVGDAVRHLRIHVQENEVTYEEASVRNISDSPLVRKRRIFLKDSHTKKYEMVLINQADYLKQEQIQESIGEEY